LIPARPDHITLPAAKKKGWLGAMRGFDFYGLHKRGQLFIRVHNETLSVVTMRVHNPDRSPVNI
jgi:hypothetical protein